MQLDIQFTESQTTFQRLLVPDLWQQQAVAALREGKDVIVQAPTGAGKTLIFELWVEDPPRKGQAVFTVPTRALANDKYREWRAKGWDVGISTGDISENVDAPVLVATLETQKRRLLRGDAPAIMAVDEYQMIADPERGLNYEIAIALAPIETQLLLTSGSVANPEDVANWLRRLGRDVVVIRSDHRPVPLEEIETDSLKYRLPSSIKGYWPKLIAKAIAEGLAPILIFAPQRQDAERLAAELAKQLPNPFPLKLSPAQKKLLGPNLTKLLEARIAYHHSGLSYAARAGVIEPLAKAGQLRVVVATMGLAAGINFSLRTVAIAGTTYRRDKEEEPLRPDELLQMFGRAGRRGIDEVGYLLVTDNGIRLIHGQPAHLKRNGMIDWPALLSLMAAAADEGRHPFRAAIEVQSKLFTTMPIPLGIEHAIKYPNTPCGLPTDAERARFVRRKYREFQNSQGEWETFIEFTEKPAKEVLVCKQNGSQQDSNIEWLPLLTYRSAVEALGFENLMKIPSDNGVRIFGSVQTVAERLRGKKFELLRWVRRLCKWEGGPISEQFLYQKIIPQIRAHFNARALQITRIEKKDGKIRLILDISNMPVRVVVDKYGKALWNPQIRVSTQPLCTSCKHLEECIKLSPRAATATIWRQLGLIDWDGVPTRRGRIVSFFSQPYGLAIVAGLEDESYPIEELIFDIANIEAGFRFSSEKDRWTGRLAIACRNLYGNRTIPGYLENGIPPNYGAGASEIVASISKDPSTKHLFVTDIAGIGDIDRLIIEWRSLLRQIAHAPELDWDRWQGFQKLARYYLNETESPTLLDLPPLEPHQKERIEHYLPLKRC